MPPPATSSTVRRPLAHACSVADLSVSSSLAFKESQRQKHTQSRPPSGPPRIYRSGNRGCKCTRSR
eukprot:12485919-Alexandrium_andersonii.AAC.1